MKTKHKMTDSDTSTQQQCRFFVQRKKRYCRMTLRPGKSYCGEHEPAPQTGEEVDTRIPCPLDAKHTCYASRLEKHLRICNAREREQPPYICRDINAVTFEDPPRRPLHQVPAETLERVIDKVNKLYQKVVSDGIATWQERDIHPAVTEEFQLASRAESSRRHLRQVSSLLHLLEAEDLVADGTCYVELGAGRGHLSYYMSRAWRPEAVLLVDRQALRHKRDGKVRADTVRRLRADLRDLALERVQAAVGARALVGVAKHLCGEGTDLALRCLTRAPVAALTRGLTLATCCHHRCRSRHYAGADHLREAGVDGEDLDVMFGLVSWATCGDGAPRGADVAGRGADGAQAERERTGRRTKAVLDWGRVLYLRRCGFEARLCRFVPWSVSPENLCIVAKKMLSPR